MSFSVQFLKTERKVSIDSRKCLAITRECDSIASGVRNPFSRIHKRELLTMSRNDGLVRPIPHVIIK